jgi:hypothetical protein
MSLLAIMALVAGIALAFKLFEQQVPNNVVRDASNFDFVVEVFRAPPGGGAPSWLQAGPPPLEPIFNEFDPVTGDPVSQFPGDTRDQSVRIRNTNNPSKAASFFMYVDQTSIVVRDCQPNPAPSFPLNQPTCGSANIVPALSADWTTFVNFWTLSVDKEKVLVHPGAFVTPGQLNENDHALGTSSDHDDTSFSNEEEVCSGGLRQIQKNAPCNLGSAKGAGSEDDLGQPTDTRWYTFHMKENDSGSDQSKFKGWTITFTMVFQARVPALPDPSPVGER